MQSSQINDLDQHTTTKAMLRLVLFLLVVLSGTDASDLSGTEASDLLRFLAQTLQTSQARPHHKQV